MKTEFREENQNYVMTFEGRLDTPSSLQVGRDMQILYDCEGHDIILDCTNLEYITSSGMRLFLDVLKAAKSKAIAEASGFNHVRTLQRRIMDVTGMTPADYRALFTRDM